MELAPRRERPLRNRQMGLGLAGWLLAVTRSVYADMKVRFKWYQLTIISSFASSGKCDAFAVAAANDTLRCVCTAGLRAAVALFAASLIGIDMMKGAIVLRQSNCRSRYVAEAGVYRAEKL